jgi:hypothetical protein
VQVEGSISGTVQFCGTVQTDTGFANSASTYSSCPGNPFVRQTNVAIEADAPRAPFDASWWNYKSHCNMYIDPALGVYFWDTDPLRPLCTGYVGNLPTPSAFPGPLGLDSVADASSCWIPAVLANAAFTTTIGPVDTSANTEWFANGACWDWRPRSVGVAVPGVGLFAPDLTYNRPAWNTCPLNPSSTFRWDAPPAGAAVTPCSNCDGTNTVLTYCPGGATTFTGNPTATPVLSIYYQGNYDPGAGMTGTVPLTQSPRVDWPMFSLYINGTLNLSGAGPFYVGVGTPQGHYPSVVANAISDTGSGTFTTAGGVFVVGGWSMTGSGSTQVFGPVHTGAGLSKNGSGSFTWDYDADLVSGAGGTPPPPPIIMYPTNF